MSAELVESATNSEILHGTIVSDPYRWLEDRDSFQTNSWIETQRIRHDHYFNSITGIDLLRRRVERCLDTENIDGPARAGRFLFYRKRRVGQQMPCIYVKEWPNGSERLLIDPEFYGPHTSASIHRVSHDGSLLSFELKQGGEHAKTILIVQVESGVVLSDRLDRGLARGFAFRTKGDGFYYIHEVIGDDECQDHSINLHCFGTRRDVDQVVLRLPRIGTSKLVLKASGEVISAVYYYEDQSRTVVDFFVAEQSDPIEWRQVCQSVAAPFIPFCAFGKLFSLYYDGVPNGAIVQLDESTGNPTGTIVPSRHLPIQQCILAGDRFFISYLDEAEYDVHIWSSNGIFLGRVPPQPGHTVTLSSRQSEMPEEIFLQTESHTSPPAILIYDPAEMRLSPWWQRNRQATDGDRRVLKLSYPSTDATQIGLRMVGRSDILTARNRPVIMTGYGGFGISMTPQYSAFISILLDLGFVFAVPEIRGGGEHGIKWHEAARRRNRQVAIDDFIAAAEWLCAEEITAPEKFAIFGGSNSGLLIAAAITQRPKLFRAAICAAPLLDMVRYHLFDRAAIWADEYGTADDPDDFRALHAYSPYHHVVGNQNYPSILFACGDRDTRCNPAHARKMTALLQDRASQTSPILLDHATERGHSPGVPLADRIDTLSRHLAFLCHELAIRIPMEDL